jgi:hypothetical protein
MWLEPTSVWVTCELRHNRAAITNTLILGYRDVSMEHTVCSTLSCYILKARGVQTTYLYLGPLSAVLSLSTVQDSKPLTHYRFTNNAVHSTAILVCLTRSCCAADTRCFLTAYKLKVYNTMPIAWVRAGNVDCHQPGRGNDC